MGLPAYVIPFEAICVGDGGRLALMRLARVILSRMSYEANADCPHALFQDRAREEEIEWESRWDRTLEASQETLERLATKALREYRSCKTKEMGFDNL